MTARRVTVPAREVRPGDRVLDPERGDFTVYDAMTTGKKAQTTSLRPVLGDPRHYTPDTPLLVERA